MAARDAYPGELTQKGLDECSDDELLDALLVDEVWTLQDIELLYGGLYNLATSVGDPETARYLTPSAANDWFNEDERVLALKFDLTDADDPYKGLDVKSHSPRLVPKLAHARYKASGQGKDHSITHMFKGNADPMKMAVDRLTDWAVDDAVASVVEDDVTDDAWVISRLAELGEDEDITSAIKTEVENRFSRDDGALITVQVKLEDDGEWLWPNEVDAFTEGMKRLQEDRMRTKNLNKGESVGEGICFATSEVGSVFGTTDDHLKMYKTRQYERFPGNRAERAWLTHPVSLDGALDEAASSAFFDACQVGAFNGSVYHLPYFPGELDAARVRDLFYALVELVRQAEQEGTNAPTARALQDIDDPYADELRFYTLVVQKPRSSPWRFLGEIQNESHFPALDISRAHDRMLETAWFDRESPYSFNGFDVDFFHRSGTLNSVASGGYLRETLPDRERRRSRDRKNIRSDDPRVQVFNALLEGRPVDYDTLISWYVERLCYVERGDVTDESQDSFYRENEKGTEVPRWRIRRQFLQLTTLANAGFIQTDDGVAAPTLDELSEATDTDVCEAQTTGIPTENDHSSMPTASGGQTDAPQKTLTTFMASDDSTDDTESSDDDSKNGVEKRRNRLKTFIRAHPPLDNDDEKKSAFLLGVLVGQLGGIQGRNVQSTVIDSHPIASISKNKLHRVTNDVLHRNNVYAKKADTNSDRMYVEVTEPLTDSILKQDPTEWKLTNEMVQFYYGLGVEWGKTHRGTPNENEADATTESADGQASN